MDRNGNVNGGIRKLPIGVQDFQIEEKGYALPYAADKRTLIKVGVSFDSEKRALSDWKAVSRL